MRLGALAERIGAADPTVSRAIDGPRRCRGIVQRRADPGDRRAVLHLATAKGEAWVTRRRGEVAAALDEALAGPHAETDTESPRASPREQAQRRAARSEATSDDRAATRPSSRGDDRSRRARGHGSPPPEDHARRPLPVSGLAYAVLSSAIVPALPTIQHSLNASETGVTWLLTGYLLSASVGTAILGRLGDMYGKEHVLVRRSWCSRRERCSTRLSFLPC